LREGVAFHVRVVFCDGFVFCVGFVWQRSGIELAESEEVGEGSLISTVEAGFVAVEEVEFVASREFGEGGGHTITGGGVGAFADFVIEQGGFDGPEAAESPGGGDHFLDGGVLDVIGGVEFLDVVLVDDLEGVAAFVVEEDAFRQEAVAEGVLGRAALAFFGFGASGFGAVGAGGEGTFRELFRHWVHLA
jgi:hypothetical protein